MPPLPLGEGQGEGCWRRNVMFSPLPFSQLEKGVIAKCLLKADS